MNRSREPVIYLPEIPWLARLMDPVSEDAGVAYAPCPLCDTGDPLIEIPSATGTMFVCLPGPNSCGQRFWVDDP